MAAAAVGCGYFAVSSSAFASAGCDFVNSGGFNTSASVILGPVTFAPGDRITIVWIEGGNNSGAARLQPAGGGSTLAVVFHNTPTLTYTVTAGVTSIQYSMFTLPGDSTSATCVAAAATSSSNTDSQKLQALQNQVSAAVAQASGAAITGAVNGAIGDAFGEGNGPITGGGSSMTLNFGAEPRSSGAKVVSSAFDAMASARNPGDMPTKAPPISAVERTWSAWADVRGTGWDSNSRASSDLKGEQINVTSGIGYKLTRNVLVGVFGGYENFNYHSDALSGRMRGDGGTIGGYAAWRILPTLRWDATLAGSRISYDAIAGAASGSFQGTRLLASTGLTGRYQMQSFVVEPSATVFALWERQNQYTDTLGALHDSRDYSAGRVSAGGRVIRPWAVSDTIVLSPYAGAYADWRFSTNNALPAGVPLVGIDNGWSARAVAGLSAAINGGAVVSIGGEYGGIGAEIQIWTASARARWTF